MYVVITEAFEELGEVSKRAVGTLEQAFAQVCCLAGYHYHFEQEQDCWKLVLIDGERPECSPEAITSTYIKRADAQRDLMQQAVDGRLKGFAAVPFAELQRQRAQAISLRAAE